MSILTLLSFSVHLVFFSYRVNIKTIIFKYCSFAGFLPVDTILLHQNSIYFVFYEADICLFFYFSPSSPCIFMDCTVLQMHRAYVATF